MYAYKYFGCAVLMCLLLVSCSFGAADGHVDAVTDEVNFVETQERTIW